MRTQPFHKRRTFLWFESRLFLATAMLLGWGFPADAHDAPRKDHGQQAAEAELAFEGVVSKVDYAMSDKGQNPEEAPLPHTFVTYQVADAPKGQSADGSVITLRFLGGPTPDGRFLVVSNSPSFEVGQRDLLFVRRNGEADCPLVDCDKGRYRVVNNQILTNDGVEVLMSPEGKMSFGRKLRTAETMRKRLGPALFSLKKAPSAPDGEETGKSQYRTAEQQLKVAGQPLDLGRFKAMLGDTIKQRHRPDQLQALKPSRSVKLGERFVSRGLAPKAPTGFQASAAALMAPQAPVTPQDQMEVEMLQKNMGNPVLQASPGGVPQLPVMPQLPGGFQRRGEEPAPEGGQPPAPQQ